MGKAWPCILRRRIFHSVKPRPPITIVRPVDFVHCVFSHIRIVKMSSPNLNVLTLAGSVLTYSSGFLFAVGEPRHPKEGESTAALQVSVPSALPGGSAEESVVNCHAAPCRLGSGPFVLAARWCLARSWGRRGDCTGCSPSECLTREW